VRPDLAVGHQMVAALETLHFLRGCVVVHAGGSDLQQPLRVRDEAPAVPELQDAFVAMTPVVMSR
jgi:hypothetical protein